VFPSYFPYLYQQATTLISPLAGRMDDNAMPDEFDGVAREFLYLIRPIQDLKENWDVDICGNLKNFIEKVAEEEGM